MSTPAPPSKPVCFFDGSLVISFVQHMQPQRQRQYVEAVMALLEASEHYRAPLVGYVDTSYANDLTAMLSAVTGRTGAERISDGALLRRRMGWGDRTTAWIVARDDAVEPVGAALEALYAGQPEGAARLAYHFEAAGLCEQAVTQLTRAAAYACRLSAPWEAIRLCRRGLRLLEELPKSETNLRSELELQMLLEMPLFVARGWGAPERASAMKRAYVLAQQIGETPSQLPILRALADVNTAQAHHHQALAYAEQALALAQRLDERTYEALGHRMSAAAHYFLGHYQEAHEHLDKGVACYHALVRAPDPNAIPAAAEMLFLWAWLPPVLFALGYPAQAAERGREALARVRDQGRGRGSVPRDEPPALGRPPLLGKAPDAGDAPHPSRVSRMGDFLPGLEPDGAGRGARRAA
jgi:tetratricopeptide (TPR) repeat protein